MHYINGQLRGGMVKTFDEREEWDDAQRRLDELLLKMPEEWELWVSRRASFQWMMEHGRRGEALPCRSGYSTSLRGASKRKSSKN